MEMLLRIWILLPLLITLAYASSSHENVTVIVAGLAGVGKSATISKLFNEKLGPIEENDFTPSLQVYSVLTDRESNSYLKIIDTAGLVVGTDAEKDGQTLAVLSDYLKRSLNKDRKPSILIIVSGFDDDRAGGESSSFVQMLKRVQLLKTHLVKASSLDANSTNNCIFLFTQMGRVVKNVARKPGKKLGVFKSIIHNFTEFLEPIVTVVGENDGEGYGFQTNSDGFTMLPNSKLYPKNLIEQMVETAKELNDSSGEVALTWLLQNYNVGNALGNVQTEEIVYDSSTMFNTAAAFRQKITGESMQIDSESEITIALQTVWDSQIEPSLKASYPNGLQVLQKVLQNLNITTGSQLPSTAVEIVQLFLKLPSSKVFEELLEKAFGIRQQPLTIPLVAGYGYDLITDSVLDATPFTINSRQTECVSTVLGYKIPVEYIVTQMEKERKDVYHYVNNLQEYIRLRLSHLENVQAVNFTNFKGQIQLAYNMKPIESQEDYFSVSGIREYWKFKLELDEGKLLLTEEFISRVSALQPFDPTDRDSEKEWKSFFGEYGTHVVTSAYGGGYMRATIELGSLIKQANASDLENLANSLLEFSSLPSFIREDARIAFGFFGGTPNSQMEGIFKLPQTQQSYFMSSWEESINLSPIILQRMLTLKPISELAHLVNFTIGEHVENAAKLLYVGQLAYKRARTSKTTTTTPTPITTTTPTTTTTAASHRPIIQRDEQTTSERPRYTLTTSSRTPHYTPSSPSNQLNPPKPTSQYSQSPHTYEQAKLNPLQPTNLIADELLPVGYGYNMFYDSGISNSPFELGKLLDTGCGFEHNEHTKILTMPPELYHASCDIVSTKAEYILKRIQLIDSNATTWFTYNTKIRRSVNESNCHFTLKPGYSIISNLRISNRISYIGEDRLYSISIDDWTYLNFTKEFRNDVAKLLPAGTGTPNCETKRAWNKFLIKYGTHVLMLRYVGRSTEVTKLVKIKQPIQGHPNLCEAVQESINVAHKADNSLPYNLDLNLLNIGMQFEELSNILKSLSYEKGAYFDKTIRNIWDYGMDANCH